MAVILDEQKVREMARVNADNSLEHVKAQQNFGKEFVQMLEEKENTDAAFADIAHLLTLPDEQFAILAPAFLEETEKSYNDPQIQLAMANIVNVYGLNEQQIEDELNETTRKMQADFAGVLSTIKLDFMIELTSAAYNAMLQVKGLAKSIVAVPIALDEGATMPEYAHLTDAGADIFANEDIDIEPGETKLIRTGVRVAIPRGYEIQVRMKSGRAARSKLRLANSVGTIDTGYLDEIQIIAENIEPRIKDLEWDPETGKVTSVLYGSPIHIAKGEKIAQLILAQVPRILWQEVGDVKSIGEDRGGGFGSSGLRSKNEQDKT